MFYIESLFWRLEKRINVWLRIETYQFEDGKIIKNNGRWRNPTEISTNELQEWQIIPEMGLDVVILKTKGGQQVVWIDTFGGGPQKPFSRTRTSVCVKLI